MTHIRLVLTSLITTVAIGMLMLLTSCANGQTATPAQLSTLRPSLLFFYTDS